MQGLLRNVVIVTILFYIRMIPSLIYCNSLGRYIYSCCIPYLYAKALLLYKTWEPPLRGNAFRPIVIPYMVIRAPLPTHSMASSSSSVPASLSIPVSKKLTWDNYRLWRAQVLSVIRAAQLKGFIKGTEKSLGKPLRLKKT
jgi:hypothetical protein